MSYSYSRPAAAAAPLAVEREINVPYKPSDTCTTTVCCTVFVPGEHGSIPDNMIIELSPDGVNDFVTVAETYTDFDVEGQVGAGGQAGGRVDLRADVPPGYYYCVKRVSGTGNIIRTIEWHWS